MDDFDLEKIMKSGQVFRMTRSSDEFQVISRNKMLRLRDASDVPAGFWHDYFDLDRDYSAIRQTILEQATPYLTQCVEFGAGLRILRQDPWEMIVTFIVSQRRSMKSIATCVEKLCAAFGTNMGEFFAFPTPAQLCAASINDIRNCGVGYRAEYIKDAAQKVQSGEIDLELCKTLNDDDLKSQLLAIKGVGEKVANCIMLFGFSRTASAPVDVWIQRVIESEFGGENPFPQFGDVAGIAQQYMFFYKTQTK